MLHFSPLEVAEDVAYSGFRGDYDIAEVKNFAFQAPRSFQG